jgi:hypothetical protein
MPTNPIRPPTLDAVKLLHQAYRNALPELVRTVALNQEALKAKLFDLLSDDEYTRMVARLDIERTLESILGMAKSHTQTTEMQHLLNLVQNFRDPTEAKAGPHKLASVTPLRPQTVEVTHVGTAMATQEKEALSVGKKPATSKRTASVPAPSEQKAPQHIGPTSRPAPKQLHAPKSPKGKKRGPRTGRPHTYTDTAINRIKALYAAGLNPAQIHMQLRREKIETPSISHIRRVALGQMRS